MKFDNCLKDQTTKLLLSENRFYLATLSRKSSESMRSSVSLGGRIFVMVNIFS